MNRFYYNTKERVLSTALRGAAYENIKTDSEWHVDQSESDLFVLKLLQNLAEGKDRENKSCEAVEADEGADNAEEPADQSANNGDPSDKHSCKTDDRTCDDACYEVNDDRNCELTAFRALFERIRPKFLESIHIILR